MAAEYFQIPVRLFNGERWAHLSALGERHDFVAERFDPKDKNLSFIGGHRVRLYCARKNVHWRIPPAIKIVDISQVQVNPGEARRQMPRQR